MGGKNPYIEGQDVEGPSKAYKLRIQGSDKVIEIDPSKVPYGHDGLPGSILDIALANGIEIDHACGGVSACSTCHVKIKKGLDSCNEALDAELDQIENAPANDFDSRLACQCIPDGSEDVEIFIPNWNRNLARESH